ncbi:hypothetical protein BsWGS_22961 [Bradybaena similaris]
MSMENSRNLTDDAQVRCPGDDNYAAESLSDPHGHCGDEESSGGVHFFPPLYIQRYTLALNCLTQHNVRSVVDFGCSECTLMKLLPTVTSLEEIALVDVDRDLLQSKKRVIEPELRHYIHRRQRPLHVMLMAGSAEVTDARLLNYDAVTLIEVIEHLEAKVLENVTHNVFGKLTPKLCVVTTPNSEFNVLFNNNDPKQFRHWDHKFEWTQQEFSQWCEQVCCEYGYRVEYSGVGRLPSRTDTEHLGPCSQAAIFTRRQEEPVSQRPGPQSSLCYQLIAESDFPFEKEVLSLEERIDMEVSYCLRQLVASHQDYVNQGEPVNIRITDLARLYTVRNLCDEFAVRKSLLRCKQHLSPDCLFVIVQPDDYDDEDDDDDDHGWLVHGENNNETDDSCHELSECQSQVGHLESPGVNCCDVYDSSVCISEHSCEELWD